MAKYKQIDTSPWFICRSSSSSILNGNFLRAYLSTCSITNLTRLVFYQNVGSGRLLMLMDFSSRLSLSAVCCAPASSASRYA